MHITSDTSGTGFFRRSTLKRFSIPDVRIDPSFIGGLQHDAADRVTVHSIITRPHRPPRYVVAMGMATEANVALFFRPSGDTRKAMARIAY